MANKGGKETSTKWKINLAANALVIGSFFWNNLKDIGMDNQVK